MSDKPGELAARFVRLAKSNVRDTYERKDWMAALHDLAASIRKSGETREQAFVRAIKTPDGLALYEAYRKARSLSFNPNPITKREDPVPGAEAWARIVAEADRWAKDQRRTHLTPAQVRAEFLKTPDGVRLMRAYDQSRAADIKRLVGSAA